MLVNLEVVLVQSDVGKPRSGRIVLPKRVAESHSLHLKRELKSPLQLKKLELHVFGTCAIEEYVRDNGLRAGDLIVLYLDTKRSKYMIRSGKDRHPARKPVSAAAKVMWVIMLVGRPGKGQEEPLWCEVFAEEGVEENRCRKSWKDRVAYSNNHDFSF